MPAYSPAELNAFVRILRAPRFQSGPPLRTDYARTMRAFNGGDVDGLVALYEGCLALSRYFLTRGRIALKTRSVVESPQGFGGADGRRYSGVLSDLDPNL